MADFNFFEPNNSFSGVLAANGIFTGPFVPSTDFTSMTCVLTGDQNIVRAEVQWSLDGVNVISPNVFAENIIPLFVGGSVTVHATVKAPFFRVFVLNDSVPQGPSFSVTTMIRTGPFNAVVSPIAVPPKDNDDALVTKSTFFGKRFGFSNPSQAPVLVDELGFLMVKPEPRSISVGGPTIVPASLIAVRMTFGPPVDVLRDELTIFNDTVRGSLYIKCAFTSSVADYHFKVPPQHTFTLPYSWRSYGGEVWGVWDEADGKALVREVS